MERTKELYSPELVLSLSTKTPPITSNLPPQAKENVKACYTEAEKRTADLLSRYGLEKGGLGKISLKTEPISPDEGGLIGGYATQDGGNEIGVNDYTVPGSGFYENYMNRLRKSENQFDKYLYKKLSSPRKNLVKTMAHEIFHVVTQMYGGLDGESDDSFIDHVYSATKEHLRPKIEQYFKRKSPEEREEILERFAIKLTTPIIEGLNEAMTYQAFGSDTNEAIKEKAAKELTGYGNLAEISTDVLEETGNRSPADFYRIYFSKGYEKAKEYVSNFFKVMSRQNRLQFD